MERQSRQRSAQPGPEAALDRRRRAPSHRQEGQPLLALQRKVGNRAVGRMLTGRQPTPPALRPLAAPRAVQRKCAACREEEDEELPLQPRLEIGPVDDPLERQADKVADAVVATRGFDFLFDGSPRRPPQPPAGNAFVGRMVVRCECKLPADPDEEELTALQGRFTQVPPRGETSILEQRIRARRGAGGHLAPASRRLMESRIGYDFSGVRLHRDEHADRLAREVHAVAFTVGRDIFFSRDAYRPGTAAGDHLLAHELSHVVQQSTASSLRTKPGTRLQRESNWDRPGYYDRQVSGRAAHHLIERELLGVNTNLVVEAPIPGATRLSTGFNKVGYADLYWSTGPNPGDDGKIAGIRGVREGEHARDVWNMVACGRGHLADTSPCRQHNFRPQGGSDRGWAPPHLPSHIDIGEIKPATRTHVGAGLFQLSNYQRGIHEFADVVRGFEPTAVPATIGVGRLTGITVPAALDYREFRSQRGGTGGLILGDRRMWIWKAQEGLLLYFDLARDLMQSGLSPEVRRAIQAAEALKDGLTGREAAVGRIGTKARPGPRPVERAGAADAVTVVVQRRPRRAERGTLERRKTQWLAEQKAFHDSFRPSLRRGAGRDLREKLAIDRQLGVSGEMESQAANREVKELQSLLFWSGAKGRFVGRIRFLLGDHFDRLQGLMDRMRERSRRVRSRFRGISGGTRIGWRARLAGLVIDVAKEALASFIGQLFGLLASCAQDAMDKVIDRFQAEITEEFAEEICRVQELWAGVKNDLETLWEPLVGDIEGWVDTISDIQWWLSLALTLEGAIRLALQIVSCLSPPALGCLWGLLAQLALEVVLDLVVGTDAFHEHVIDPVVNRLINDVFAAPLFGLVNDALGPDLSEFHCRLPETTRGSGAGRLGVPLPQGMNAAETVAHRDRWMAEHDAEIRQALAGLVTDSSGSPATPEQMQRFLEQVDGWDPDQIRRALEASRGAGGTVDISEATRRAGGGPEGPPSRPMTPEEVQLPPPRPVSVAASQMDPADVVRLDEDLSPCASVQTLCSSITVDSGGPSPVEVHLVPYEAFDAWFRNLNGPQRQQVLQGLPGADLPYLPPAGSQPGTVPVLELRFDIPTPR